MDETSKIRVAAYCRVSTDKDDQANSLASQKQYFEEYIKQKLEWQLVEIYHDDGISGTSIKKRDDFNRMIADAEAGKIDLILTKEVSRFARNTVDTLQITRELKQMGVRVKFMNDNIDTFDTDGELRLTIMASIAQEESRKTSERVKWGQKRRMEQGVVFGRDLLGYRVQNGKLEIVPEEAEVVRLIFYKYLHEGKGCTTIGKELREAGICTIKGNLWSNTVILRVLRNEKYVGDLLQKKTFTPDYLTHSKKYNNGEEEMVYIQNHHEPIIDRETWEATQREIQRRSPDPNRRSKYSNRYWCSGKMRCGECGNIIVSRKRKRKDGGFTKTWMCVAATQQGVSKLDKNGKIVGCNNKAVNEKVLKAAMHQVLSLIKLDKQQLVNEVMNEIRSVQNANPKVVNIDKIKNEILVLENKKTRIIDAFMDKLITEEELQKQKKYYNAQIEALQNKLAAHKQVEKQKADKIDYLERCVQELEKILNFEEEDEELYGEILEQIIFLHDRKLEVRLKGIPFSIQLTYETAGKMEDYTVEFTEVKVMPSSENDAE